MEEVTVDVCVIGCGAGGFGASITALEKGRSVAIIERNQGPGGVNVWGYVSQWPTGPGDAISKNLYQEMVKSNPDKVGIAKNYISKNGVGLWMNDPNLNPQPNYSQTLNRIKDGLKIDKSDIYQVNYNASALRQAMETQLSNANLKQDSNLLYEYYESVIHDVSTNSDNTEINFVHCVNVNTGSITKITAKFFIDGTGFASVARLANVKTMYGEESKSQFDEQSAPKDPKLIVNATSLCYRLKFTGKSQPINNDFKCNEYSNAGSLSQSAYVTGLVGQNIYVTPLQYNVVDGGSEVSNFQQEIVSLGKYMANCNWSHVQSTFSKKNFKELGLNLDQYEFDGYASMLYVRESYRIVGEYILTETDIMDGLQKQINENGNDIIALAQHTLDFHPGPYGNDYDYAHHPPFTTSSPPVNYTYGIPYRCLVPKDFKNLLVACNGASFSHIAASSARLQRVMMALGKASGFAAHLAIDNNLNSAMDIHKDSNLLKLLVSEMQDSYGMNSKWEGGEINQ